MSEEIKHSPLPYKWVTPADSDKFTHELMYLVDGNGLKILSCGDSTHYYPSEGEEPYSADAEFIVRACNNHYELLEALKKVRHVSQKAIDGYENEQDSMCADGVYECVINNYEAAQAAISKAEAIHA